MTQMTGQLDENYVSPSWLTIRQMWFDTHGPMAAATGGLRHEDALCILIETPAAPIVAWAFDANAGIRARRVYTLWAPLYKDNYPGNFTAPDEYSFVLDYPDSLSIVLAHYLKYLEFCWREYNPYLP